MYVIFSSTKIKENEEVCEEFFLNKHCLKDLENFSYASGLVQQFYSKASGKQDTNNSILF